MTFDIHITVELQPSSQLVELLQSWQPRQPEPKQPAMPSMGETERMLHPGPEQPEIKPQEAKEPPKGRPPVQRATHKIMEVPAFSEFTTEQPICLSKNLHYAESEKGLVMIKYLSGTIYTLWSEIMQACAMKANNNAKPIPSGKGGNKSTALNQFIEYVERGLRKGQAAGRQEDLDADFRPMLQQNTRADYDGNKLEGSLED